MHIRTAVNMILAAAAAAVAMPAAVSAQETGATLALEEIVVSARKRDEALEDVPVAVNAFNAEEIESAGINRPADFIALTPNMQLVQTQNQGTSFIVVRGISQARNSEPSVAVMIDGVLLANPSQFNQELFDVESIQVLKGPQGALYGRNAIGGAIIINTRQPTEILEGSVTLGYESGPGIKARASVGGPLAGSETLKFQLSGSYFDTDGHITNTYLGEEADPFTDFSLRGRLIWEPSEQFKADLRVSQSRVETQALYFNITEDVNDTSLNVRVNNRGNNERDIASISLKLDYEFDNGVTLTSVSAYDTLEEILTGDQFNFLPVEESVLFAFFDADQAQHQWLDVEAVSQEIRFTSPSDQRLRWIAGAYLIQTDRFISTGNVFDLSPSVPGWTVPEVKRTPLPLFNPQFSFLADSQDNTAWALFGELSYDITEAVELSVALRYDEDERENTTETPQEFIPAPLQGVAFPGQVRKETWDELQPKVTLRWKPTDDTMVYGGYSRGFRSGGFNQTGVGSTQPPIAGIDDLFDEEVADTYEAGVKAQFMDRRVSTSFTAFYTEAEGTYFFVFDPGTSTQNLGNLEEVTYTGFEAELQALVTDHLEVYARGGYTDSEIKKSSRDPADVGNQAPLVSEYTINLGLNYRAPLPGDSGLDFFVRPDFRIIGDTWFYPDNFTKRDPVELLDLRAGIAGEAWTLTAWARNLTDEEYNAEWSPGPQFFPNPGNTNNFVFKAQPRVWGIDFNYRF